MSRTRGQSLVARRAAEMAQATFALAMQRERGEDLKKEATEELFAKVPGLADAKAKAEKKRKKPKGPRPAGSYRHARVRSGRKLRGKIEGVTGTQAHDPKTTKSMVRSNYRARAGRWDGKTDRHVKVRMRNEEFQRWVQDLLHDTKPQILNLLEGL